jgi:hypothetical protein
LGEKRLLELAGGAGIVLGAGKLSSGGASVGAASSGDWPGAPNDGPSVLQSAALCSIGPRLTTFGRV